MLCVLSNNEYPPLVEGADGQACIQGCDMRQAGPLDGRLFKGRGETVTFCYGFRTSSGGGALLVGASAVQ
ncbi:hypothetical protein ALP29_201764 [Pseudomonas syringae pv. avii]|uniref:Uncharacterized protein n=1 Tax=Pseudomonas syringae pv. avii TaxID=663959 RepID=A0A3M5VZJ5_PSESX|nr:hypothetical protein ALP29_201764 [Pseudomonas syringae pv. avii]